MKSIRVKYFALLKEQVGFDEELMYTELKTYGELYEHLAQRYSWDLPSSMIQVAVNDEFTSLGSSILDKCKIVFIPPVAGG